MREASPTTGQNALPKSVLMWVIASISKLNIIFIDQIVKKNKQQLKIIHSFSCVISCFDVNNGYKKMIHELQKVFCISNKKIWICI